jgi:hypothetical protein
MKLGFKYVAAAVVAAGLSGCSDPTGDTFAGFSGAAIAAGVANVAGANETVTAVAAVFGAGAGQVINRSATGGCASTGTTSRVFDGGHVFIHRRSGQIIQCPVGSIANNKVVEDFYKSPDWQAVNTGAGRNAPSGLRVRGFKF